LLYFVKISGEAIYGFIQLNCVYIWHYSTHEMISNSFMLSSWEKLVTIHNRFSLYFHLDFPSSFYDVNTCSSRFLDCSESSSPISSWIHVFLRTFIHFHPLFLKKIVSILHFFGIFPASFVSSFLHFISIYGWFFVNVFLIWSWFYIHHIFHNVSTSCSRSHSIFATRFWFSLLCSS
jgi:hypothetical protein